MGERNGWGYDEQGYDVNGFTAYNKGAIHKDTGTKYDSEGFDKKGYDKEGFDRDGYHIEGFHKDGYNEDGYDKNGYDKNGINREGINRKTGKKDERIEFAEEFIASGQSIEEFAKQKQIPTEQVIEMIEKVRLSPSINEDVDSALEKNSNSYLRIEKNKKEQLLSGEISITDVSGIKDVIKACNSYERKIIIKMLIQAMASHEISVLQYRDILDIKCINSNLPQNIIQQINGLRRSAGPLSKELHREMNRLKAYRLPYIASEGETLGYKEKPTDKEPKLVTITDKHRDMARRYLEATDEFVCSKTMNITLMKIIKGEIGIEQIERVQKESELRRLQKKDGELGELIGKSERFIKESQGKTQTVPDIDNK